MRKCLRKLAIPRVRLFAIVMQLLQIENRYTGIFKLEETSLLQFLQTLVRILARDADERPDFLLGDVEMARGLRIEDRIEQRRDAARQPRGRVQGSSMFDEADELAEPFVELTDQKAVEADAVLEQPEERGASWRCESRGAPPDHSAAPRS